MSLSRCPAIRTAVAGTIKGCPKKTQFSIIILIIQPTHIVRVEKHFLTSGVQKFRYHIEKIYEVMRLFVHPITLCT